jgi:hypothetical protein
MRLREIDGAARNRLNDFNFSYMHPLIRWHLCQKDKRGIHDHLYDLRSLKHRAWGILGCKSRRLCKHVMFLHHSKNEKCLIKNIGSMNDRRRAATQTARQRLRGEDLLLSPLPPLKPFMISKNIYLIGGDVWFSFDGDTPSPKMSVLERTLS